MNTLLDFSRSNRPLVKAGFSTTLTDIFENGMVAHIGPAAFTILQAIKAYADYNTGIAWPGMRAIGEKVGMSKTTVQRAIVILEKNHLLRVEKGKKIRSTNRYVARECVQLKLGNLQLCTIVIDYVPAKLKARLANVRLAFEKGESNPELLANVEIIVADGFVFDAKSNSFRSKVVIEEVKKEVSDGYIKFKEALGKTH